MNYLLIGFGLIVIYIVLGIQLERHQIITEPSTWALYGMLFGAMLFRIMLGFVEGL